MTGPEHYQEAERLLAEAAGNSASMGQLAAVTAAAKVHATLALAAATALQHRAGGLPTFDSADWHQVAARQSKRGAS